MARSGWDRLSPRYRGRLQGRGITRAEWEAGASLKGARGHAQTPEHPVKHIRHSAKKHRREQWAVDRHNNRFRANWMRQALRNVKGPKVAISAEGDVLVTDAKFHYTRNPATGKYTDVEEDIIDTVAGSAVTKTALLRAITEFTDPDGTVRAEELAQAMVPAEYGYWLRMERFTFAQGMPPQGSRR